MAKATMTIKQMLGYQSHHVAWFAANQTLFNRVVSFYFEVIAAHENVLDLKNKDALTALETLTHTTEANPHPVMPLCAIEPNIPAMFRRAAINAAMGSARAFYSSLRVWRMRKEKTIVKGKPFREHPPVPPRTWNKSVTCYAGMWKDRSEHGMMLKVWNGTCWVWLKVRIMGRDVPEDGELGSPQLVCKGNRWWVHTSIERTITSPGIIEKQVTTNPQTKLCSVDLNLGEHIAVCSIQMVEGTILATQFIGGGNEISGLRKQQLGRIARNRSKTGIIAEDQQDNVALWDKIRHVDESMAHLVSARIVQFAQSHGATILVFEHLGNLKPAKGKYSRRGNAKRAYWMKGRIYNDAKYKAWNAGIITSRVRPWNTSRECARCHGMIVRYAQGQPREGYTMGTPLSYCPACGLHGNADRNASIVIGQRLVARYHHQEKPHTLVRRAERVEKSTGDLISQDAKRNEGPSILLVGHGNETGHGTAHDAPLRMDEHASLIPTQLRLFNE